MTGSVSHIVEILYLYGNFNVEDNKLTTTTTHLNIIHTSGDGQGLGFR